jgi:parallel beta-helix repeat protein
MADGDQLTVSCIAPIGAAGLTLSHKTGVIVDGAGVGGFVALGANALHILFAIEYCDGCIIRSLAIDSRNLPAAGISINYSNAARIEANTIQNVAYPAYAALLGLGNHANVYTWNTISSTGAYVLNGVLTDGVRGIWLGNPSPQWIEWDSVITNNKVFNTGWTGIAVNGAGASVSNNYIEATQGSGIKIEQPPATGGRSLVQWNTAVRNRFSGVQVQNGSSAVFVQGNTLDANQISGVYSDGAFTDGEISGNLITNSGEAGIYLYDAQGALIEDNQIIGGKTGITFEVLQPDTIQDVRMHSNNVTSVSENGLVLLGHGGTMRGVALDSNAFQNVKLYGMSIDEMNAGAIIGPSLVANCFSNMGSGTLLDTRTTGALKAPVAAASCPKPPQSRFRPIRINAGGGAYMDTKRQLWQADNDFIEGNQFSAVGTVIDTPTPDLYLTGKWRFDSLDFSFDVPNGVYTVTLKFAETHFQNAGQRVFDIFINGELVAPSFDILAYADPFMAVDRSFRVTVTGGKIAVHMVAKVDAPMINAVEVQ